VALLKAYRHAGYHHAGYHHAGYHHAGYRHVGDYLPDSAFRVLLLLLLLLPLELEQDRREEFSKTAGPRPTAMNAAPWPTATKRATMLGATPAQLAAATAMLDVPEEAELSRESEFECERRLIIFGVPILRLKWLRVIRRMMCSL